MRILIFFLLFSLAKAGMVFAQSDIAAKMELYGKVKSAGSFFVHFDKNVYTNSETAYFTGYLLRPGKIPLNQHKVISVALIRDIDTTLVLEDKFAMEGGISFGSITLPDSILTGNYHFLVYTEYLVNGMPDVMFRQNVTLKSTFDPSFRSHIRLMSPQPDAQQNYQVLVSATSTDGRFLPKPVQVEYGYGALKKSIKTDASGQVLFDLPATYQPADPKVYVKLKYNKDSAFINLNIPAQKSHARVNFYPEGGNLVTGLLSTVGWEIKDQQNRPLSLKAVLYKDQHMIDTIESSSYGIGKFSLKPEKGATYSLKPIHSALADSVYLLPQALPAGMTITVPDALATDTLVVQLRSAGEQQVTLLIHNFNACFLNFPYRVTVDVLRMRISLENVPKGLTTLTVLDSLNRPLAERIFFAHYQPGEKISLSTDQPAYKKREKVNLKLLLKADEKAVVSVAVTQDNRNEHQKMTDMESYSYITSQLSALPVVSNGRPYSNTEYLSQILLVKGWRRYLWTEMLNVHPADTAYTQDQLKISGLISQKKPLTAPVQIGILGDKKFQVFQTDNSGHITFKNEDLVSPADKKLYLFINGSQNLPGQSKLRIQDGFEKLNVKLSRIKPDDMAIMPSELVNNAVLVIPNNEKILRLKEVVIKSTNSPVSGYASGANACGDYVCRNHILNCRNHISDPYNTQPIKGQYYSINGIMKVYSGCNPVDQSIFTLVKGIHEPKEFYVDDYKDPNEPAFFSTLYWNYAVMMDAGKPIDLSFLTSDITGKFRVVVQGVSTNDVVYGETSFEVKDK